MSRTLVALALAPLAGCALVIGLQDVPPDVSDAGGTDAASDVVANDGNTPDASIDAAPDCGALQCPSGKCANDDCVRRIFVTLQAFDGGALGGIAGADTSCNTAAATFTTAPFRAWLSDVTSSPSMWTVHGTAPYELVDGKTIIANDWTELTSGTLKHMINLDEQGVPVNNAGVWTQTAADGTLQTGTNGCMSWVSSNSTDTATVGNTASSNSNWTGPSAVMCNSQAHLYCVEQ